MKTTQLEAAHEEMGYETFEGQFGNDQSVSYPAGFACSPDATLDVDALEQELDRKGLGFFAEYTKRSEDGRFRFDFEIYTRDYKRIVGKMWPDALRLYPREDGPTLGELAQVTSGIERTMDTTLTHDPVDDE